MPLYRHLHFVYHHSMDVSDQMDFAISRIASAIGEPARVRILYCLLDGHARTSTELAVVADVSPSTASAHLNRLRIEKLIKLIVQGKHRYYSLDGPNVARALEGLSVIAGASRLPFVPTTPSRLRNARTCYDHMAGALAVSLHNHFKEMRWIVTKVSGGDDKTYDLTPKGLKALEELGIDVAATRTMRRRFAYACLDWSERQPHLGGALAAALLKTMLKRKWVLGDLDSRALSVTSLGRHEVLKRFGIQV